MPRSRRIDPDVEAEEAEVEEAAPTRRARRAATPPPAEEAKPVRRRPAEEDVEDDDEEDEEEAPPAPRRRAAKAKPVAEEEEAPVRRRAAKPVDRETGDEDSDDEAAVIPISRGRKQIAKDKPVSEASLAFFRWDEEEQLVKFLEDDPWGYNQHWVKRDGKQSFPCLGKGCPLCAIGVRANQKIVYSLVNLVPVGADGPLTQTLEVGQQLDETLTKYATSSKTGPLTRLWWVLSRTETAGSTASRKKYSYAINPVKDRDLGEDWEIDLDDAETVVDAAEIPEPDDVIGKWTRVQLQEIADEQMGH